MNKPLSPVALPIGVEQIAAMLPHRYPFLLIDRVTAFEHGTRVTVLKNITFNEPFFQGHFPGHPVMPGVLIIEAMAQAAGILGLKTRQVHNPEERDPRVTYLLAGVDNARFKRQVIPGDRLDFRATLGSSKRGIYKFFCEASVDGQLVTSVELLVAERQVV